MKPQKFSSIIGVVGNTQAGLFKGVVRSSRATLTGVATSTVKYLVLEEYP